MQKCQWEHTKALREIEDLQEKSYYTESQGKVMTMSMIFIAIIGIFLIFYKIILNRDYHIPIS